MEHLNQRLNYLEARLTAIEEKLAQIPIPFKLMYRPPEHKEHIDIVDYLNAVDAAIKKLNDRVSSLGNFV